VKATFLSCTLKSSPEESNTEALAQVLIDELERNDVECVMHRLADREIKFGTNSDEGEGDEWPAIRADIVGSEILVVATPTWVGHPSSIAQLALERMDAMLAETDDEERPIAYGKVAGVVVTGNEDGAHHVISEICGALNDIGFTTPGQAWTYWNQGPGPGDKYLETDVGKDWSHSTGVTAARNLIAAARAFDPNPFAAPPS
jgi:multimeric flavodoxin WrbA